MHITPVSALETLKGSGKLFTELFSHGTLSVEIYKPQGQDLQTPHHRDEVYVVIAGTGQFVLEDQIFDFHPGDFLFVPAGAIHRFVDFTADFSTWVIFYGPAGGESDPVTEDGL